MGTASPFWFRQLLVVDGEAGAGRNSSEARDANVLSTLISRLELPVLVTLTFCSPNRPSRTGPKLGGLLAVSGEVAADAAGAATTAGIRPTDTNSPTHTPARMGSRRRAARRSPWWRKLNMTVPLRWQPDGNHSS